MPLDPYSTDPGGWAGGVEPRPPSASRVVMSELMQPTDANAAGDVHGGAIMKMVDNAAGVCAMRHCRRRVVTASMDEMSFLSPVNVGELVTVSASVNDAGRTSLEVGVRVVAEDLRTGQRKHTSSAYLVMVALDETGHPTPVPPLVAETDDDRRRQAQARIRREQRLARREALKEWARQQQESVEQV
ncbi:MAG: acyl-CoA thioesterase [Candidatus Dormibacteria bacterium]